MATTTPDDLWTPDAGDAYALTTDLAAGMDTVQTALNTVRGEAQIALEAAEEALEEAIDDLRDEVALDLATVYAEGALSGTRSSGAVFAQVTMTPSSVTGMGTSGNSFVVQKPGVYMLSAYASFTDNMPSDTRSALGLAINGSVITGSTYGLVTSSKVRMSVAGLAMLSENDEISVYAYQQAGTSRDFETPASFVSVSRIPFQVAP